FHPYDRWGFKSMPREVDDRYLRYVVARLAAYRNVWWSMANEFDLMLKIPSKKMSDWDRFFQVVRDADPYGHPRGNHNCHGWYDHTKSWITHCSIQSSDFAHPRQWREKYRKPIVYDECKYEGNIPQGWGKISAREMVRRFWLGTIAGCYVGHGETYRHPKDILWWSKGGVLHGESPARIAFLRKLVEPLPFADMTPEPLSGGAHVLSVPGQLYLVYCDGPDKVTLKLAGERSYRADAIDTWGMTVEALGAAQPGEFSYTPPGRGWLVRLSALAPGEKILARPELSAEPAGGKAPLEVRFSFRTPEAGALRRLWDFGDGESSTDAAPVHVYTKPGMYTARLTVTDDEGRSAGATISISAEGAPGEAIVRVGFKEGDHPRASLHGRIARAKDGSYDLPAGPPWGWIAVGERPIEALEGLRSFTIAGWARPTELDTGRGGNRIAFNLKYNRAGFDLVHHEDGRLRLSVNEWPDQVRNDSSRGKLRAGEWTFFAVAYDSTKPRDNVRWYFGRADTPAALDSTTSYSPGPTGEGSGPLTIGNYNTTIHRHGTDRQFRGSLHGIRILGSRTGPGGALSLEAVRRLQSEPGAVPDFKAAPARSPPAGARPRIIATTDGEIDDRCSMVRFLLYANEWDIEGIIHCSSKFHWKGDGKGIKRHNWADEVWLDKQIDQYEQLYPKLSRHAEGFPTADALRKLVYTGNVVNVGEMSQDTPGSDRIVEILLDAKPGPVYLQAWGGTNTIARALWKIEHEHRDQMAKVSRKAVIYIILDQDNTFRRYIQPNWPDIQVLGSFRQFATVAYSWDRKIPRELHRYFDRDWMQRNILRGHGPLCARYEVHGKKGFRSEGDSPAFMHQIPVGLRSLEHPGYGGWGGRFVKDRRGRNVWRGARDGGDLGKPIWRWAEAFQNDWAARADWCVKGVREANHPPRAKVAGPLDRTVRPGQKVTLSAEGSTDPDGNTLAYRWWQYDDVDTVTTKIDIADAEAKTGASFIVPDEPGKTVHVILAVTDDGDPPLTRYRRIIFTIGR
ncbi:MAG: nucleoside hydrolase-like domain-containing protein, partial [Planctomycetota bacterium]